MFDTVTFITIYLSIS